MIYYLSRIKLPFVSGHQTHVSLIESEEHLIPDSLLPTYLTTQTACFLGVRVGPQWAVHQCPYVPYGALLPLTDMEVGAYCRSKMLLIHKVLKNWLPEQCHTFDLQDIHCVVFLTQPQKRYVSPSRLVYTFTWYANV